MPAMLWCRLFSALLLHVELIYLCTVHCASGKLICLCTVQCAVCKRRADLPAESGQVDPRWERQAWQERLHRRYTRFVVHKGHKRQEKLHRTKCVSKRLERLYYWGWVLSHIPVQFSSSRQPHVSNEKVERGQNNNNGSIRWVGDGRG